MKASERTALEVGLQGPIGLHIGRGLCQTARSAVFTTAIQPFGGHGADSIKASTPLTHLQSRPRLLTDTASSCSWRGHIASGSLRAHSLELSPSTEARGPPVSRSDPHTLSQY